MVVDEESEGENDGVEIVRDEIQEQLARIKQAMAAKGIKFTIDMTEEERKAHDQAIKDQKLVDTQFKEVMKEYDDDKIGALENDEEVQDEMDFLDKLGEEEDEEFVGDDEMNDALDEFIDQNKGRFRNLYQKFGDKNKDDESQAPDLLPPNVLTATEAQEIQAKEEREQYVKDRGEFIRKARLLEEKYEEDHQKEYLKTKARIDAGEDIRELAAYCKEDRFDVETIVSTYTNTDNHPGLIKEVIRPKKNLMKIAQKIQV